MGDKNSHKLRISCYGDSLTYGSSGYSYIKYLKQKHDAVFLNRGVNGDSAHRMYDRLRLSFNEPFSVLSDVYIIDIGTNDLLQPFLIRESPLWKIIMSIRTRIMDCLTDDAAFSRQYEEIIKSILVRKKKLILVGLPLLEIREYSNEPVERRNGIIRSLAQKHKVPFVDVADIQKKFRAQNTQLYSWKYKCAERATDALAFMISPSLKDEFCRLRHLTFTVDGVHWNSAFAKAVSDKIDKVLKGVLAEDNNMSAGL